MYKEVLNQELVKRLLVCNRTVKRCVLLCSFLYYAHLPVNMSSQNTWCSPTLKATPQKKPMHPEFMPLVLKSPILNLKEEKPWYLTTTNLQISALKLFLKFISPFTTLVLDNTCTKRCATLDSILNKIGIKKTQKIEQNRAETGFYHQNTYSGNHKAVLRLQAWGSI